MFAGVVYVGDFFDAFGDPFGIEDGVSDADVRQGRTPIFLMNASRLAWACLNKNYTMYFSILSYLQAEMCVYCDLDYKDIEVMPEWYAAGYRFVKNSTGQMILIVSLAVVEGGELL